MVELVFISHSSKDGKVARAICTALEKRGQPCWIASRDVCPGENFMVAIVHAIRTAKVMVLVFSEHANNSEEVKREVVLASNHNIPVIPVRIENVAPGDALSYQLATRQWIDLFDDWESQLERLTTWIGGIPPGRAADGATVPKPEVRANLQNSVSDMAGAGSNHLRRDTGNNRYAELGCALDLSGIWSGAVSYKADSYNYEWFMTQEGQHVSGTIALSNRDGGRRSAYFFVGDIRENKLYFRGTKWFSPPEVEWCIASGELNIPAPGSSYNELRGTWGPGPVDVENPCPSGGGEIYLRRKEPFWRSITAPKCCPRGRPASANNEQRTT